MAIMYLPPSTPRTPKWTFMYPFPMQCRRTLEEIAKSKDKDEVVASPKYID